MRSITNNLPTNVVALDCNDPLGLRVARRVAQGVLGLNEAHDDVDG